MAAPTRDWDDEFANMKHIPGSDTLLKRWNDAASAYRDSGVRIDEITYGDHEREKCDLIWPDGTPKGLAIFVHGGYWIRTEKSYYTHYAEGARANGWAVCLPQYVLAPENRIAQITQRIGAAINIVATMVAGPIHIAGHSAGGHLVSRMMCTDSPLEKDVQSRIEHCVSISGLHDLRPLMNTEMNKEQRLDEAEARAESAALLRPVAGASVTAWVGGGERPEFIRQAKLLGMIWDGLDGAVEVVVDGQHDHFSVLEDLQKSDSPLTRAFVG